jgi:hypothetical protein
MTPIPSRTTTETSALQTGTSQCGKNGGPYSSKAHSCCLGYVDILKWILSIHFVQLLSIALYRAFKFTLRCSTWSDIQMRNNTYQ